MAYKALYREWRPQTFADVVGQTHVVKTLTNALRQGRLAHAYLFSGPRGTGKTSLAKLLAKAVNCEQPVDSEPCNVCSACIGITSGAILDVTEMDAASNRGVDEIRSLLEQVQYTPTEVRYKVYIIDEVHMLTTEAFNALLKTLEEPPAYCLFVLATTELHKVPATIASRCQRFEFGRARAELVVELLRRIVSELSADVEEAALWQIARATEGGLRDALSLLDQTMAFADGRIGVEEVSAVLGGVTSERLGQLFAALLRGDHGDLLLRLAHIWEQGTDPGQLLADLIAYGRDAILLKHAVAGGAAAQRSQYDPTFAVVVRDASVVDLLAIVERFARVQAELRFQTQVQLVVEMALLACSPEQPKHSVSSSSTSTGAEDAEVKLMLAKLTKRIEQLEAALAGRADAPARQKAPAAPVQVPVEATSVSVAQPARDRPPTAPVAPPTVVTAAASKRIDQRGLRELTSAEQTLLSMLVARWSEILEDIKQRSIQTRAWLSAGRPVAVCDKVVWVAFKSALHGETVMKSPHAELIAEVVSARADQSLRLRAITEEEWLVLESALTSKAETSATIEAHEPWVEKVIEWFGEERVTILAE